MVLDKIKQNGFFWFSPDLWDKCGKEIEILLAKGVISSLEDEGITTMNGSYCYVLKGNPDGVREVKKNLPTGSKEGFLQRGD